MSNPGMTPQAWEAGGKRINFKGHSVFYRESGEANTPCLLLMHGYPTSSWDWHQLWSALSEHFRLIAPDMLGMGFSDKPMDIEYSVALQADLYETLMLDCGVSETHVLAHDLGDTVAQELLARQLDGSPGFNIQSVALLNGGLFPEVHKALFVQKLMMTPIGPWLARLLNRSRFEKSMRGISGKPLSETEIEGWWQIIRRDDGHIVLAKIIHYMRERKQHRERWFSALNKFEGPLVFVNGLKDPISGEHMLKRFQELLPQHDSVALADLGHYPQSEDPRLVFNSLHNFWRKVNLLKGRTS